MSRAGHGAECRQCYGFRQLKWVSFLDIPITEMTKVAGNYGYTLTLLVMPDAEYRWRRRDEDEEPVEDSYDRFLSRGQKPY